MTKKRLTLEGVGAALLLLLPYYCKFLLPSNLALYHHRLPVTHLLGGILLDMLAYAILATGFLAAVQHLPRRAAIVLEALFAGLMVWAIVDFANLELIHLQYRIEFWSRIWWRGAVFVPLLSAVLAWLFPRVAEPAAHAVRLCVAGVAFSALWIVPQLLHVALAPRPDQNAAPARLSVPEQGVSHRRIIWILFDELSYHQTFDRPAADIQLPNFDRMRGESFSFGNVRPAGSYTERIIPSLFIGQPIDEIRSSTDGRLFYRNDSSRGWIAYDPNATLFALAQRNGWNTGIDGWFIPYCRTLAPVAGSCSWEPNLMLIEEYGASEDRSALANAALMPSRFLALFHRTTTPEEGHIAIYRNIVAHARALIGDNRIQFVFLHIPVPHGPGIYDRRRRVLRPGGTYLDRLALADETLGVLMKEIDATGSAGQTTVIVSSDHSWRIFLSRHSEEWSDEEERASGGCFDDRPVLLVRFPDRKTGRSVDAALPEMLEHDMIAAMLLGQIKSPEDMNAFISRRGR
jgi:hypothetical protein